MSTEAYILLPQGHATNEEARSTAGITGPAWSPHDSERRHRDDPGLGARFNLLKREVTAGPDRSIHGRRVRAAIEVQAHGLSWDLSVALPYASALAVAEAELTQPVDKVSEVLVAQAVGNVASRLGQMLADITASELPLESTPPEVDISERSASAGDDAPGIQTWTSSWDACNHAEVTLAPLTPRPAH